MKKETQVIYATNKKVPELIRLFIEEGIMDKHLKKESLQRFEKDTIKFVRAKKGKEEVIIPMYEEHRQLKLGYFNYTVYAKTNKIIEKVNPIVLLWKKIRFYTITFFRNIKWWGL